MLDEGNSCLNRLAYFPNSNQSNDTEVVDVDNTREIVVDNSNVIQVQSQPPLPEI
jgi:hypothetical protein